MDFKYSFKLLTVIFLASLVLALAGCGGGGGGGENQGNINPVENQGDINPNAAISVDPAAFDFLTLTEDNSAPLKEVVIQSSGSADLRISSIAFFNAIAFTLDLDPAQDPCGPLVREAIPLKFGERCRFYVGFEPPKENAPAEFEKALVIQSNATVPSFPLVVRGTYDRASAINVAISQIDACERPSEATVYVSLTDQAGFPIKGLTGAAFSLRERPLGGDFVPVAARLDGFVDVERLSVSLLMDYSGSIADRDLRNMETAGIAFVRRLQEDDEAEVIKYDSEIVTMQGFTSDLDRLEAAINEAPGLARGGTALYDAIAAATTERSAGTERSKERKAIIILTDGEDTSSAIELGDALAAAQTDGIPLFIVGFGEERNTDVLQRLADETGGVYFDSEASDNLEAIYVKLADLLFENQYVLRYRSALAPDESGSLELRVDALGRSGIAERTIPACE